GAALARHLPLRPRQSRLASTAGARHESAMSRMRADLLLVARGLAESRAKARAAIEAGGVTANGAPVEKPADLIAEDAALEFTPPHPWVSRGGVKLAAALEAFGVDAKARICLDVGAS